MGLWVQVLPSIVNEVLKSEVARHNATQLITNREQVPNPQCIPSVLGMGDFFNSDFGCGCRLTHWDPSH